MTVNPKPFRSGNPIGTQQASCALLLVSRHVGNAKPRELSGTLLQRLLVGIAVFFALLFLPSKTLWLIHHVRKRANMNTSPLLHRCCHKQVQVHEHLRRCRFKLDLCLR